MSAAAMVSTAAHIFDVPPLPAQLRTANRWLLWKFEPSGKGKPRKVPYWTNGRKRSGRQDSPEDRKNLATYDSALRAKARGEYDGLGLATGAGWHGLDLDCVIDGSSGDARFEPWALELIERARELGAYIELSPSGNGVHILGYGEPFEKLTDNKSGIEAFAAGQFLTVTEMGGVFKPRSDLTLPDLAPLTPAVRVMHSEHKGRLLWNPARVIKALREIDRLHPEWVNYRVEWIRVGMALKAGSADEGLAIWDEWSRRGEKWDATCCAREWRTFKEKEGGITLASLFHWAKTSEVSETSVGRVAFDRNDNGAVRLSRSNLQMALRQPDICGTTIEEDTFLHQVLVVGKNGIKRPLEDEDYGRIAEHLERFHKFPHIRVELMRESVAIVAQENRYDSLKAWLDRLEWDGVPRIATFLQDTLGAEDSPYVQAVGCYLFSALAGRALQPGTKADMTLVLVGKQGTGKSSVARAIAPIPEQFGELGLDIDYKEQARLMQGKCVLELSELDGLNKKEDEALKGFLTRTADEWRKIYREAPTIAPRRCIFIGTTNVDNFLKDPSGHRRWLPVRVAVDGAARDVRTAVAMVNANREQLWAEGKAVFLSDGIAWKQAGVLARDIHGEFEVEEDVWTSRVLELAGLNHEFVLIAQVLDGMDIPTGQQTMIAQKRVAAILKKAGWKQNRTKHVRGWTNDQGSAESHARARGDI